MPRYCEFRRQLHLKAPASFEELTDNPEWAAQLRQVYGDVERVDTMVGMFAETRPEGFAFSDTAFRVFILMASRRLNSDRFFTEDLTPEVYTKAGMKWIDDNEMVTVLLRHFRVCARSCAGRTTPSRPGRRRRPPAWTTLSLVHCAGRAAASVIKAAARSASAPIVSDGLRPIAPGTMLPSTTNRLGWPKTSPR